MTAQELEQQPTFPQEYHYATGQHIVEPGLTKLELFTLKAMQGILAYPGPVTIETVSIEAVQFAKATLAKLAKEL